MLICKQQQPEKRQPTDVLMLSQEPALQPASPATDDSEGDETQWEAYLAQLTRHQYGECASGCDRSDGALSSGGCRW